MERLVQKFRIDYCSEVVEHTYSDNCGLFDEKVSTKFKIVAENGKGYSNLKIYILNDEGLQQIADQRDIPDYVYVDYVDDRTRRLDCSKHNMQVAEEWIKSVFK